MTNRFAIGFGLLILALIGLDLFINDSRTSLFLVRKFADFIEYLSFWR